MGEDESKGLTGRARDQFGFATLGARNTATSPFRNSPWLASLRGIRVSSPLIVALKIRFSRMWIAEALREIKNALKDQENSIGSAADTGKNNSRDRPRTEVVVQPDEPEHNSGAESEKKRTPEWGMVVPTWIAAVATLIAAGGAIIYACITSRQLQTSQHQVRMDERAWVFVRNIAPTKQCPWRAIEFVNSGRTPTLDFSIRAGMGTVSKGNAPTSTDEQRLQEKGIIAPGGAVSSCIGDQSIDKADWSKYDLFVHGRLDYTDVFGYQHWTKFCFKRDADGNFIPCESGNEMDRNDLSQP